MNKKSFIILKQIYILRYILYNLFRVFVFEWEGKKKIKRRIDVKKFRGKETNLTRPRSATVIFYTR